MIIWRNIERNKEVLNAAAKSGAFIIFDTETTGTGRDDDIIELAAYKCRYSRANGGFTKYEIFHEFIKPDVPVSEGASKVNGITNEFLKNKATIHEIMPKVLEFFGENPVVGAYNSPFDVRMMKHMYEKTGHQFMPLLEIDLLKIAKDIFCEQKLRDHKLGTIAKTYGVDQGITFHSAIDDVEVLLRVTNAMIDDMNRNCKKNDLKKINVYQVNYYDGFRGDKRIYIPTSEGTIYYAIKDDRWGAKDDVNLSLIDMEDVERQVFEKSGCGNYKDIFAKYAKIALEKRAAV